MKRRFASPLGISPKFNSCGNGVCFLANSDDGPGIRQSDLKNFSSPLGKPAKKSNGDDAVNLKHVQTEQLHSDSHTDVRPRCRKGDSVEIPETPNARVRTTLLKKDNRRQSRRSNKPSQPSSPVDSATATAVTTSRFQILQPAGLQISNAEQLKCKFSDVRSQSPKTFSLSNYAKASERPSNSCSLRQPRAQSSSRVNPGSKENVVCQLLPAGQNSFSQNRSAFIRERHELASESNEQTVNEESHHSVGTGKNSAPCSVQVDVGGRQTAKRRDLNLDERKGNISQSRGNSIPGAIQIGAGRSPRVSEGKHNSGPTNRPVLQVLDCPPMLQAAEVLPSRTGRNLAMLLASNSRKIVTADNQETDPTTSVMMKFEPISVALQKLRALLQPSSLPFTEVLKQNIKQNKSFQTLVHELSEPHQEQFEHCASRGNIHDKERHEEFEFVPVNGVKLSRGNEKGPSLVADGADLSIQTQGRHSSEQAASSRISDESTLQRLSSQDKGSDGSHLSSNGDDKFSDFLRVTRRPKADQDDLATTADKMRIDNCLQKSCLYEAQRSEFQNIWHSKHLKMAEVVKACMPQQDFLFGLLV